MYLFFEPTITVAIIGGIVTLLGGGGAGTLITWLVFRRRHNAEADGLQITNDLNEGLARKKLLKDNEELNEKNNLLTEERDKAREDARKNKNLYDARDSEVNYLRLQAKTFWMAEGGCLERERMNSEKISNMARDHAVEIAEMKRDFENQIEDVKAQLREALQFKEKNAELADENTRILAENEELRKRDGAA